MEKLLTPYKVFVKVFFVDFPFHIKFKISILGIYLFNEAIYRLRMEQFLLSNDSSNFDYLFDHIMEFQSAATVDYLKLMRLGLNGINSWI